MLRRDEFCWVMYISISVQLCPYPYMFTYISMSISITKRYGYAHATTIRTLLSHIYENFIFQIWIYRHIFDFFSGIILYILIYRNTFPPRYKLWVKHSYIVFFCSFPTPFGREKKLYNAVAVSQKASRATPPACVTRVLLARFASPEKLSASLKRGLRSSARPRGTAWCSL